MRDVLKQWVSKYLNYASVKDELIGIYAGELTENELKQLAAFYNTPAGKRWTEVMPKINAKATQLGAAHAQAHQAELQKMIQEQQSTQAAPENSRRLLPGAAVFDQPRPGRLPGKTWRQFIHTRWLD